MCGYIHICTSIFHGAVPRPGAWAYDLCGDPPDPARVASALNSDRCWRGWTGRAIREEEVGLLACEVRQYCFSYLSPPQLKARREEFERALGDRRPEARRERREHEEEQHEEGVGGKHGAVDLICFHVGPCRLCDVVPVSTRRPIQVLNMK